MTHSLNLDRLSLLVLVFMTTLTMALPESSVAATVFDPPPATWRQGSWGFAASTEYFMSDANYDDVRGSFTRLTDDGSLSALETRLKARYGFSPNFSLFGGTGLNYVRVLDAVNEKTNSSPTEAFLGGDFIVWRKWLRAIAEVEGGFSLNPTSRTQVKPLTSDGVAYVKAGLFLSKRLRWFKLGSHLGFHVPMEGLAKRFVYDVSLEVPFGTQFAIGAGIDGYEAAMEDELTFASRTQTTTIANGGSQRYYAYDPALLQAKLWLSFKPDSEWLIKAGYAKTIDGLRTAEGQSLLLAIEFNPPALAGAERRAGKKKAKPSPEQAMKTFEPEVEKVDQSIFEDDFPESEEPETTLDDAEKVLEDRPQ